MTAKRQGRTRKTEDASRKANRHALSPLPSPLSPASRRGIVLLIVLALLALFGLIAVAFVIIAGQSQRGAKSIETIEQGPATPGSESRKVLNQAIMQVLRGPNTDPDSADPNILVPNRGSVMRAHSLLETMYGHDTKTGNIQYATVVGAAGAQFPQLINLTVGGVTAAELARRGGCVLTITGNQNMATGNPDASVPTPGLGLSTRIVGGDYSVTPPVIQVLAFPNGWIPVPTTNAGGQAVQFRFTINGVPFSGTGFGYDTTTHDLNAIYSLGATLPTCPIALLPNLPLSVYNNVRIGINYNPAGGANSDYTAADFQHMLLAAQVPNAAMPGGIQTLPSMHRPALCRYWASQPGVLTTPPIFANAAGTAGLAPSATNMPAALKRAIVLRPLPDDHPNFTGSNPAYQPVDQTVVANLYKTGFNPLWDGQTMTYPDWSGTQPPFSWDVDNDGDGTPDSVWVDLGLPVRSMPDGRRYKPLFAILCVDLDGRLNLNAHGSIQQTDSTYNTLVDNSLTQLPAQQFAGGVIPPSSTLPRGLGFGPAEISLLPLLNNNTLYTQLLTGVTVSGIAYEGRYGSTPVPGAAGLDVLCANKWFDYGPSYGLNNYWDFTNVNNAGSYGCPPDPFGVGATALDQAGRPVYAGCSSSGAYVGLGSSLQNNPYEINLGLNVARGLAAGTASPDNPFSPSELERVIRPFDRDAPTLPPRLALLTAANPGNPATSVLTSTPAKRLSVTTDSSDVPCPVVATPANLTTAQRLALSDGRMKHVTDLLTARGILTTAWRDLLSPEMLVGLKMNLNQPLGNGRDELGVGVDSPAETTSQSLALSGNTVNTTSFDGISDSNSPTTSLAARQREARFLYVLACLTVDTATLKTNLNTKTKTATDDDVARFLAQWAVNVVDFRDRDSIMTRFDYDPKFATAADLSAGWVDPTDGMHTVFGCERPELLLTETLAFHDRRTEDTASEKVDSSEGGLQTDAGTTKDTDPKKQDTSFDQRFRPQGSLFIELFNPWTSREPRPKELSSGTVPNSDGIDLTKVTPTGSSPVWRLAIVDAADAAKDPDYYDPTDSTNVPKIERTVYFVGPGVTLPSDGAKVQFRQDANNAIAPILPGRYVVVGPGDAGLTTSKTYLGFRTGENPGSVTSANPQRRIELHPSSDPAVQQQVRIYNDGTNDSLASASIQPPVAVIINSPQRLSISEPDNGYKKVAADDTTPITATGEYQPAWDIPLDKNSGLVSTMLTAVETNGRTDSLKVVHLQRLANPLLPHNPIPGTAGYNPYRTVDSMPIDLYAFNGITTDKEPGVTDGTEQGFYARQRGQNNGSITNNLWSQEEWGKPPKSNATVPSLTLTSFVNQAALNHTLSFLNDPFGQPNNVTGYVGDPRSPFPWLTWNNRPYVNALELLQVPWVSSSQLLAKFQLDTSSSNPYTDASKPFAHLTNMFLSGNTALNEEMHRVLEYVGVPSPFAGTETWARPDLAASSSGHAYHPPFNRISTYREPGRININTIYGDATGSLPPPAWQGLMAGFPLMNNATMWKAFVNSRRASGDTNANPLAMPATPLTCPTEFARPFRSFGGAAMVPSSVSTMKPNREIDSTLMRADSSGTRPLFEFDSSLPGGATIGDYNNPDRNPYFRYQSLQRLGNLVTTRSNVYAVWITVGYFQVTPAPSGNPAIYPDGYQLGQELGMDTGEIERHRAFYIIDRTIPVGFKRGQDLNAEKAILVNRFIE